MPARSRGPGKGRKRVLEEASEAEAQIVAALRDKPMRHAEIVRATVRKATSTSLRLQRLQKRGLVQRDDEGLWSSSSP
jgi:hypothetical protein